MKSVTIGSILMVFMYSSTIAQDVNNIQMPELLNKPGRTIINVPDILGYKTLKCDFHMHTVFSDGIVWPTVRVDEAWNEGLDAIAITDHIERNPSKRFVGGDDNSSYEIARSRAEEKNILLIRAGEITRRMPPGHFNALFIDDVSLLDTPDYMEAFKSASEQGGYVIWNHPGWKAQQPDTCKWWDIHTELHRRGWLHGVEVFNEKEWYPVALDWCIEKELAVIGTSDIHGITSETYDLEKYHRPMTLVLAEERTAESIREALFAGRTIAWFGHNLAGKEEYLEAFVEEAIEISLFNVSGKGKVYSITNHSDVPFEMNRHDGSVFTIPANGETMVPIPQVNTNSFVVTNLYVGGTENLEISITQGD
jgi:hypothetical protein